MTDYTQFVLSKAKPKGEIYFDINADKLFLWHGATGLAGEMEELMEALLRPGIQPGLYEDVQEELGDIEFFITYLIAAIWGDKIYARLDNLSLDLETIYPRRAAEQSMVEATHVLDAVKKHAVYNKALDTARIANSLVVIKANLSYVYEAMDIDRNETIQKNMDKLNKRYPSGSYSNADAQARADKEEA